MKTAKIQKNSLKHRKAYSTHLRTVLFEMMFQIFILELCLFAWIVLSMHKIIIVYIPNAVSKIIAAHKARRERLRYARTYIYGQHPLPHTKP